MPISKLNQRPNSGAFALPAAEHFLTPDQAAALIGLSPRTMARFRLSGTGPRYSRVGRRVRYTRADINAWVESRKFGSTSEEDISRRA
ncbi:helix-turn-helix domain-containing protein [Hyphomicrobium sp. B1]|uniref:helix-turn-helix transcriptional regulator n=1 Tax=Hyphomicrobium sp. B1 TaxID=3075651 RepID=UPI003C2D9B3B